MLRFENERYFIDCLNIRHRYHCFPLNITKEREFITNAV